MNFNQRAENETSSANIRNEREFEIIYEEIREYSTIKQILEGNCEKVLY